MRKFQDRIYAVSEKGILVWEPSWDTFRPVEKIVWNTATKQVEPYFGLYTHDIFDTHYGYGNETMYNFCIEFTDKNAYDIKHTPEITNIELFWSWCGTPLIWKQDRPISLHPCSVSSFDRKEFLRQFNLRSKTFKHAPRNIKGTRKVIPQ